MESPLQDGSERKLSFGACGMVGNLLRLDSMLTRMPFMWWSAFISASILAFREISG